MRINKTMLATLITTIAATTPVLAQTPSKSPITVFTAKKIITMDATRPVATAVAVRDGQILGVGSVEDLKPWLKDQSYTLDDQFKDKVIMPGFIEPHLHPIVGALLFTTVWITPEPWNIMGQETLAVKGHKAYLTALQKAFNESPEANKPFITWGYSAFFHGDLNRAELDTISKTRPIMVWERSTHQGYFNTAALNLLQISAELVKNNPQANYADGHFWEDTFFSLIIPRLLKYHFFDLSLLGKEYKKTGDYLNYNGITTVSDMSTGIANWDLEIKAIQQAYDHKESALRVLITPDPFHIAQLKKISADDAFALILKCNQYNSAHVLCNKTIKLFADGAMFSQMMKISAPGYIDGHEGIWLTPKDTLIELAGLYWNAGYQIHVHTNGDEGLKRVLDMLEQLQDSKPRADARFTIEHYGYATAGVARRIAKLGAIVSANPFYIYDLANAFAKHGLGADRAARIVPLRSLVKQNIPIALHSDFGMAPAQPLLLAQIAATRQTLNGKVVSPQEKLTVAQALRAITIDAAYILHMEDTLGSIEAGKAADFTILTQDPYAVPLNQLSTIKIWGTVFAGQTFKAVDPLS